MDLERMLWGHLPMLYVTGQPQVELDLNLKSSPQAEMIHSQANLIHPPNLLLTFKPKHRRCDLT